MSLAPLLALRCAEHVCGVELAIAWGTQPRDAVSCCHNCCSSLRPTSLPAITELDSLFLLLPVLRFNVCTTHSKHTGACLCKSPLSRPP